MDSVSVTDSIPAPQAPFLPFENMALCFSGGGFRAAAYSLGVLSLLNEVHYGDGGKPLLRQVRYISSASGGTITAGLYALRTTDKDFSFVKFYRELLVLLEGDALLKRALEILTTDKYWVDASHCKTRNLINAFALAYNDAGYFNGATFQSLLATEEARYHHLDEVCFNSTDLFKGLTFRQQLQVGKHKAANMYFGNGYLHVSDSFALKLRLADALAASSCFPAGFEPMSFPDDFLVKKEDRQCYINDVYDALCNSTLITTEKEKETLQKHGFGLMDGGITDNLALDSLMLADQRGRKKPENNNAAILTGRFGLIMVNDVSSHFMDAYTVPDGKGNFFTNWFTLNMVFWLILAIAILSGAGLVSQFFLSGQLTKWAVLFPSAILFGSSVTVLGIWFLVRRYIFSTTKSGANLNKSFSDEIIDRLYNYLSKTPLHVLGLLGTARAKSVITLNTDLFLKNNRRMVLEKLYQSDTWKNRRKSNHIYDLSSTNQGRTAIDLHPLPEELRKRLWPTPQVMLTAEKAFRMSTTLWFDKEHQQKELDTKSKIVATGQFTTCHNLILHILKLQKLDVWATIPLEEQEHISHVYNQLLEMWDKFQEDPMYLHNELQKRQPVVEPQEGVLA